jgi:hypothetical protein
MKRLKLSALTLAMTAVTALIGGSAASATEVYSGNTTLGIGTVTHVTLESESSGLFTDTSGNPIDTCRGTTGSGKALSAGSSTTTPKGIVEVLVNESCTQPTTTLNGGEGEIHHIAGTDNGTVTSMHTVVTVSVFGVSCRYGTGQGTDLGTLTGKTSTSEFATMDVNAIINEQEPKQFLCPDTAKWLASYIITSPAGVNVRAS